MPSLVLADEVSNPDGSVCDPPTIAPQIFLPDHFTVLRTIGLPAFDEEPGNRLRLYNNVPALPDLSVANSLNLRVHEIGAPSSLETPAAPANSGETERHVLEPDAVYIVELGQRSDGTPELVGFGRRVGEMGGQGRIAIGDVAEITGTAEIGSRNVATSGALDLHLFRVPIGNSGAILSAVARSAVTIDSEIGFGPRAGRLSHGGGVVFLVPSGARYPMRVGIMAAPEIQFGGPDRVGVSGTVMTGAELLMF